MFIGVITQPQPENNFNGLLIIKQLSEQQILHLDYNINLLIVEGEWRRLYDVPMYTIAELSQLIVENYQLGDDVADTLCVWYSNQEGDQQQYEGLLENEMLQNKYVASPAGQRELTIEDVELSCYYSQGSIVEKEVNCNSQFMLWALPVIAA